MSWGNDGVENAKIDKASIFIEDHGILTFFLDLRLASGLCQGFGGWQNDKSLGLFVKRILEVLGVFRWDQLPGLIIRVKREDGLLVAIGHPIEDKWFEPRKECP